MKNGFSNCQGEIHWERFDILLVPDSLVPKLHIWSENMASILVVVNTSGKAGAQIPQLPLGDDSSPWGR
jgi:hypothetical protein